MIYCDKCGNRVHVTGPCRKCQKIAKAKQAEGRAQQHPTLSANLAPQSPKQRKEIANMTGCAHKDREWRLGNWTCVKCGHIARQKLDLPGRVIGKRHTPNQNDAPEYYTEGRAQ